jgi:hypothetical protein
LRITLEGRKRKDTMEHAEGAVVALFVVIVAVIVVANRGKKMSKMF